MHLQIKNKNKKHLQTLIFKMVSVARVSSSIGTHWPNSCRSIEFVGAFNPIRWCTKNSDHEYEKYQVDHVFIFSCVYTISIFPI